MPRWLRILLGIAISGGLLALVLAPLDLDAAWASAKAADTRWLWASLGISFAVLLVRSARFHALVTQASFPAVTAALAAQNFLLRVTPLRAGELSLPLFLSRASGESAAQTLVSLVLVRLVDLTVLLACAAAAGLAWFGAEGRGALVIIGVAIVGLVGVLARFRACLLFGLRVGAWLLQRTRLDRFAFANTAVAKLRSVLDDEARLTRRQWAAVTVTTVAITALQFALFAALLRAFGSTPDPRQLIVAAALAQITGALPVLTVGSIGTHEAGWIAGFVWVGLPLEEAALTGVATQVVTLAFAAIFAVPAGLRLARRV